MAASCFSVLLSRPAPAGRGELVVNGELDRSDVIRGARKSRYLNIRDDSYYLFREIEVAVINRKNTSGSQCFFSGSNSESQSMPVYLCLPLSRNHRLTALTSVSSALTSVSSSIYPGSNIRLLPQSASIIIIIKHHIISSSSNSNKQVKRWAWALILRLPPSQQPYPFQPMQRVIFRTT